MIDFLVQYHTVSGKKLCFKHAVVAALEDGLDIQQTVVARSDSEYDMTEYDSCAVCSEIEAKKLKELEAQYEQREQATGTGWSSKELQRKKEGTKCEQTEKGTKWDTSKPSANNEL